MDEMDFVLRWTNNTCKVGVTLKEVKEILARATSPKDVHELNLIVEHLDKAYKAMMQRKKEILG